MIILICSVFLLFFHLFFNSFFSYPDLKKIIYLNDTVTPSFFSFISGYGISFIASLISVYLIAKKKDNGFEFILFWFVFCIFLVYSPFHFSRYFLLGFIIPLSILTVYSVKYFIRFLIPVLRKRLMMRSFIELHSIDKEAVNSNLKNILMLILYSIILLGISSSIILYTDFLIRSV